MYFIRVKEEYIDFLKEKEPRIPNQDYGIGKYKPFYILDSLNSNSDILYVTQLTSPKSRHYHMKENDDFMKIYHPVSGALLSATNLNYMFPVLPEYIEHLSFNDLNDILQDINKVRTLAMEKNALDKINLHDKFTKLYTLKMEQPDNPVSKRSLDFKSLEANLLEYKLQEQFYREDIKVERSQDYSTFFIRTENEVYEYSESILDDMYGFLGDISEKLQDEVKIEKGFYLE